MKVTVKNSWILEFNAVRAYLNLVDKTTNRVIVPVGRDVAYAIARTAKYTQSQLSILHAKELERDTLKSDTWLAEWKALLDTEIEIEVHCFQLTDLPKDIQVPEDFFRVLDPLIQH